VTKAWHHRDPEAVARDTAAVRRAYPHLHFLPDDEHINIQGGFPVTLDGMILDRFRLSATVPGEYPKAVPVVRETGGRIPWDRDRHIEPDGKACLFLEEERGVYFPVGAPLLDFFRGPVNSFFLGQLYFEEFGTWPFGQRAHGRAGIIEFYAEKLGTADLRTIIAAVEYLQHGEIKGHWPCPCGNGKRLRDCHMPQLAALRRTVSPEVARRCYANLRAGPP